MSEQDKFQFQNDRVTFYFPDPNPFAPENLENMLLELGNAPYTPLEGDYQVKPESTVFEPNHYVYHFWQFKDGGWEKMYRCSQPVKDANLKGYTCVRYADETDGTYYYWRQK